MSIKVVLFDLDGTLLPMEQEAFLKRYFGLLAKKMAPYGYEADKLIETIWAGTAAMVKNSGEQTNEEVFWQKFCEMYGEEVKKDIPMFDEYYRNEFQMAKDACGYNPQAAQTVALLKSKGIRTALATNPLFPKIATESRIRWAGLEPEDFEFYTTYETSRHCKPNVQYYMDIAEQLKVSPQECLMVGNDVAEDMAAAEIGMEVFLLTDCLINKEQKDISVYAGGDFSKLQEVIEKL